MTDSPGEPRPIPNTTIPCRHLRNKGMYVYTADLASGEYEAGDSSNFWCLKTMKGYGPDDDPVDRDSCRDTGRPCYEPL
jgi:hypothetical protein